MEVMWRDHDARGTKLSSYSAIVQIKCYRVCAIVWYFVHVVLM